MATCAAVLIIALAYVVLGALFGSDSKLPSPRVDSASVPDVSGSPNGASHAIDVAPRPSRVPAEGVSRVTVFSEDREPLSDVLALPVDGSPLPLDTQGTDPEVEASAIATSGANGELAIANGKIPTDGEVALWRLGYEPLLLRGIAPGGDREAVLRQSFEARLIVQRDDGSPVVGFRIAAARAAPELSLGVSAEKRAVMALRDPAAGGGVFVGSSDPAGAIVVRGLARGRYFLQCNVDRAPYSSFRAPVSIDVPGPPVTLTVYEYWGAAIHFSGDEVIARNQPALGLQAMFRSPTSALEHSVVDKATKELQSRHPAATVLVGIPRKTVAASRVATVQVFGRFGGWSIHHVRLCPLSELVSPQIILLPGGVSDMTALLRVVPTDGGAGTVELPGASALAVFQEGEYTTWVPMPLATQQRLPAAKCTIHPFRALPEHAFDAREVAIVAGSEEEVPIPMHHLMGYSVEACLKDGTLPTKWGLELMADGHRHIPCREPAHLFYSSTDSIPYVVYVQGYSPVSGVLRHAPVNVEHGRVQKFSVALSDLGERPKPASREHLKTSQS